MCYTAAMDELTVLPDQSEILHYDDPSFPLYLRRNTLSLYPGKRVLCHWHPELEFFLVEKGNPSYFVNGSDIDLKEGECLFVNSKLPHYGYSKDGEDSTYLVLVFHPSLLSACPEVSETFINPLKENSDLPFLLLPKDKTVRLYDEMKKMFEELQKKDTGYQLMVLSHLYAFWAEFLSLKGQEKNIQAAPSTKTHLLQKMLTYIYTHYSEKITLDDIASSASLSSGYVNHLFKDLLHLSPMSYLLACRIEKSEELLRDYSQDITQISEAVGFESPSYFTEMFKRQKGYSPREYRRMLKQTK